MSVHATAWAWDQELPAREKMVLLVLADHANADLECWPSRALIAQRSGHSESTVKRVIAALEESGHIERARRDRGNGSQSSNLYRLNPTGAAQSTDVNNAVEIGGRLRVAVAAQGGVNLNPRGGQSEPPGGSDCTPGGVNLNPPGGVNLNPLEPPLEPTMEVEGAAEAATPAKPAKPAKATARGELLPEGWQPSPRVREALAAEFPHLDLYREFLMFTDHFRAASGQVARKRDWDAAFRNWVRRSARHAPRSGNWGHDAVTVGLQSMLQPDRGTTNGYTPSILGEIER